MDPPGGAASAEQDVAAGDLGAGEGGGLGRWDRGLG